MKITIYNIITIIMLVLFIGAPIIQKIIQKKKIKKNKGRKEKSVKGTEHKKPIIIAVPKTHDEHRDEIKSPVSFLSDINMKFKEYSVIPIEKEKITARQRIEKLPDLKKAVIWAEILGPPKGEVP